MDEIFSKIFCMDKRLSLKLIRLLAYFSLTFLVVVSVNLTNLFKNGKNIVPRMLLFYHKMLLRSMGFHLVVSGEISSSIPTLFVANHASYIDIEVLGSLITGSFIGRSDIEKWPLYGYLARLQKTVFIDRTKRLDVKGQFGAILDRLRAGDNLILFAEGTSNDGNRVLPFKSSLLAVAEEVIVGSPLTVQPVAVSYTLLDGIPLGRISRPLLAWYGGMDLVPHFWQMVGLGKVTVDVRFYQPVTIEAFTNRKELTKYCEKTIAKGVSDALSGRSGKVDLRH